MTHCNAIRFLAHQARLCRDRDSCEAFCLLLPAMVRIFEMDPMEDIEAEAFKYEFRLLLQKLPFQDAADREASRPAVLAYAMHENKPDETTKKLPGARNPGSMAQGSVARCPA